MVARLRSQANIIYPDSDGKPMADNTKQFRWIVVIQQNLEWLFANDSNVFVAGDLLWYPVEGQNTIVTAPDVMVVFGRPKGDRGSYKQWQEDNLPPHVVFEILSPSNSQTEMAKKLIFYDRYGVEEYYLYDPDRQDLAGWKRTPDDLDLPGRLNIIDPIHDWVSPRLGIRFDLSEGELRLFHPDGEPFLNYTEIAQQREQARQQAEQARQQAEQAENRAIDAENRAARLADRLRSLGIDPQE
jgi:Uma2 family endonuclease